MKRLIYIIATFLVLGIWFTACRSIKYVPVETVKHDSIYVNRIKYDSIYHKDSVYFAERGDTIYLYKYKYQYRDKLIRDTVNVTKVDTIKVPYPQKRSLTKWEQIKVKVGGLSIGMLLVMIMFLIICNLLKVNSIKWHRLLRKIISIFKI